MSVSLPLASDEGEESSRSFFSFCREGGTRSAGEEEYSEEDEAGYCFPSGGEEGESSYLRLEFGKDGCEGVDVVFRSLLWVEFLSWRCWVIREGCRILSCAFLGLRTFATVDFLVISLTALFRNLGLVLGVLEVLGACGMFVVVGSEITKCGPLLGSCASIGFCDLFFLLFGGMFCFSSAFRIFFPLALHISKKAFATQVHIFSTTSLLVRLSIFRNMSWYISPAAAWSATGSSDMSHWMFAALVGFCSGMNQHAIDSFCSLGKSWATVWRSCFLCCADFGQKKSAWSLESDSGHHGHGILGVLDSLSNVGSLRRHVR